MEENQNSKISDWVKEYCTKMNCMACNFADPSYSECKYSKDKTEYLKELNSIKTFIFDYEATIDISGTVHVKAKTKAEAREIAYKLVEKNLEVEDATIELGFENNNDDDVTIREIGNPKKINMNDGMSLN